MPSSALPLAPYPPDLPADAEPLRELDVARGDELLDAVLEAVDLSGADLRDALLRDVRAVDGSWANLRADSARFRRVEARGIRATGGDFGGASLEDVTFRGCRLDLASFRFATLERVRFEDCRLDEADFFDAKLTSTVFVDCSLVHASLAGARFARSELRGCDLTAIGNAERLRGVRMPWPDVVTSAAALAAAVGIEILDS